MRLWRVVTMRARSLFGRSSMDAADRRELELHLEMLTRENVENGMSATDARLAALRSMGNLANIEERSRDARGVRYLHDLSDDVHFALRLLRKAPAFTAVAVLSLALGIGANTAIFTLIKRSYLERLPVPKPEQIVRVTLSGLTSPERSSFTYPLYREMAAANTAFEGLFCISGGRVSLVGGDGAAAESISIELVSGNFYQVLGVKPHLGRLLTPENDRIDATQTAVVLSHAYWRRRFASDTSIVGRTIRINTYPVTVIGVSPPGFDGLNQGWSPDAVMPVVAQAQAFQSPSSLNSRGHWWLGIGGRLKEGASTRQAELSLEPVVRPYFTERAQLPNTPPRVQKEYHSYRVHARPVATGWHREPTRAANSMALLGITGMLLLAACTNLAGLLLARAAARRSEMPMRLALGAGRARIVRQLLTESLCLAVLGGILGLGLAVATGPLVVRLSLGDDPHITQSAAPDMTVLLFCLAVTTFCGLFFGLVPAWQTARTDLSQSIGTTRSVAGTRLIGRKALLSAQIALTLLLLAGAALFMRSLQSMKSADLGLEPGHILQLSLLPKNAGYKDEQIPPYLERVMDQIRSVPGVRSASVSVIPVMANGSWGSGIQIESKTVGSSDRGPDRNAVGPRYFATMGIPMLLGRDFTETDGENAPRVAIVNEAFAQYYFGNENPIGRRIDQSRDGKEPPRYTVVGVAKNGRYRGVRDKTTRFWYIPHAQSDLRSYFTIYVQTSGDPANAASGVRQAVANVDSNVAVLNVRTLEDQIAAGQRFERMVALFSSFFGVLAAILAAIGIYGVLSYLVSQRQREIGIRLALGATPSSVAGLVVSNIVGWIALGILLALPAIYYGSHAVRDVLFEVEPMDAQALLWAGGALAAIALLSALFPARRAASIQPSVALRTD